MILSILHFVDTKSVKTRTTGCIYLTWRCLHVLKQWNVTRVLQSLIKQHSQWRTAIMRKISLIQVGEMFKMFHYINCFHFHSIDLLICELNKIVRCSSNTDFSLTDWMTSHSIDKIENIQPPQASELLLELGLDHFLSEPERCTLMDEKYRTGDSNGWNNGKFFQI